MKEALIILFAFVSLQSFAQYKDTIVELLRGTWVKTTGAPDTIKFSMMLHHYNGLELILANRPKPQGGPAGIYDFKTLGTTMLVHWIPSGSSHSEAITFYFDSNHQNLSLGNFYHAEGEGKLLTFRRVKKVY